MKSFISKKVKSLYSDINKCGMFATQIICPGEICYVKGGHIVLKGEFFSSSVINSYLPISDDLVIGALTEDEEKDIKLYNNHACVPNCCMRGEISFIAIKQIEIGEELTVDYAFIDNEPYRFACECKNADCRKVITGYDWQLEIVQNNYPREYFSSYIQTKLKTGLKYKTLNQLNSKIKDLRKSVFTDELGFNEKDEFDGDERGYIHCCLLLQDKLIAYARVEIKKDYARIGRIVVQKDMRNKGYGRQILFWAETEVLKNNVHQVQIHALDSSVKFYSKLDYEIDGDEFIEENKPHRLMKKQLEFDT